jgi:hypothetical protein
MRTVGLGLLSLLLVAAPRAQSATTTVTVDLIATTAAGAPVRNLRPEDLVVRVDGRVQAVTVIRYAPAPATPAGPLPPPYATNATDPGRTTAVLVDASRLTTTHADAVRAGLAQLTGALGPLDRTALIPLASESRPVDFTTAHERLTEAGAALVLASEIPRSNRQDEEAVGALLGAVERAMALVGPEPGVKTLVLATAPFRVTSRLRRAMQSVGESAARHRIALYVAAPGASGIAPNDGVHALAAATGGLLLETTWADAVTRERARVEVTLAASDDLDAGEVVRAVVGTARTDLRLRFTPFAFAAPTGPAALESLTDMLRQSRTFTDLPLRIDAIPIRHTDRAGIRLFIVGEAVDPDRPLAWSEFALLTPDGRLVSQWTEDREAVTARPLVSGAVVPEGTYRLRWAASELAGRRGTVDVDVEVRLWDAGPFRVSGLMLGHLQTDVFVPVLHPDDDAANVEWYAEVYGTAPDNATLSARLDVRRAPGDAPLLSADGQVRTSPEPDRRAMTGQVSVADLPAGDYQFAATLVIDGRDAGTVTRTFRKSR